MLVTVLVAFEVFMELALNVPLQHPTRSWLAVGPESFDTCAMEMCCPAHGDSHMLYTTTVH